LCYLPHASTYRKRISVFSRSLSFVFSPKIFLLDTKSTLVFFLEEKAY
jgi:hypothetical protein